jgi:hypothetical protein
MKIYINIFICAYFHTFRTQKCTSCFFLFSTIFQDDSIEIVLLIAFDIYIVLCCVDTTFSQFPNIYLFGSFQSFVTSSVTMNSLVLPVSHGDRFLEIGLLNQRVKAHLVLLDIAKLPPIKIISFCIPLTVCEGARVPTPHHQSVLSNFWNFANLIGE